MTRYYIVVYDVSVERVNKVHKILKKYFFWMQNSVFEGYLEDKKYKQMIKEIRKIINFDEDLLIIYSLRSHRYLRKEIYGSVKRNYTPVV